jgi:hypothetical protein
MNSEPADRPAPSARRFRILRWVLIGCSVCIAGAVLAAVQVMSLGRDATRLRDDVFDSFHMRPTSRIQITVGPILLGLARGVVSAIDRVPPEARLALRTVRNASVGIYGFTREREDGNAGEMFASADRVMAQRGWQRIVAVNDLDAQVMVFTRTENGSGSAQHICVAVRSDSRLVIVSGTVDPEPLADLVAQRGWRLRL